MATILAGQYIPENGEFEKKTNSFFSIKDMHCQWVLTFLVTYRDKLFAKTRQKNSRISIFWYPYFRVLPVPVDICCLIIFFPTKRTILEFAIYKSHSFFWEYFCLRRWLLGIHWFSCFLNATLYRTRLGLPLIILQGKDTGFTFSLIQKCRHWKNHVVQLPEAADKTEGGVSFCHHHHRRDHYWDQMYTVCTGPRCNVHLLWRLVGSTLLINKSRQSSSGSEPYQPSREVSSPSVRLRLVEW